MAVVADASRAVSGDSGLAGRACSGTCAGAPGYGRGLKRLPMNCSIRFTYCRSSFPTKVMASPDAPARRHPANPMDVVLRICGTSKLMTCEMPVTSMPRAAMSVATMTRNFPRLNPFQCAFTLCLRAIGVDGDCGIPCAQDDGRSCLHHVSFEKTSTLSICFGVYARGSSTFIFASRADCVEMLGHFLDGIVLLARLNRLRIAQETRMPYARTSLVIVAENSNVCRSLGMLLMIFRIS